MLKEVEWLLEQRMVVSTNNYRDIYKGFFGTFENRDVSLKNDRRSFVGGRESERSCVRATLAGEKGLLSRGRRGGGLSR